VICFRKPKEEWPADLRRLRNADERGSKKAKSKEPRAKSIELIFFLLLASSPMLKESAKISIGISGNQRAVLAFMRSRPSRYPVSMQNWSFSLSDVKRPTGMGWRGRITVREMSSWD